MCLSEGVAFLLRRRLGHDNNYFDLAQNLRQRITDMKIKIDRQLRALAALKDRVKDQVVEMERLEVDIDIKLRSCKGSCSSYSEHQVDKESYVTLEKQVTQLDSRTPQSIETVGTLYVMKSRPLRDAVVDSIYKAAGHTTVAAQQTEDLFPDVKTVQLILEQEGSSTSPATISKVPGTSYSAATGTSSSSSTMTTSSSSSSSSTPSKSITEMGGRGDGDLFGGGYGGGYGGGHGGGHGAGHVCGRLKQQSKDGRQSLSHTWTRRQQHCRAKSDAPLCSDEDWVSKCPSGCRLQGLISQAETEIERKLLDVCKMVKTYEDAAEKTMTVMTRIYNSNRRVIVNRYTSELKFEEQAEELARNLTSLRKRLFGLSQRLKEMNGKVQRQIGDLYRAEVDIDMKLRSCRGSCQSAPPFAVNHPSYHSLQTDMDQMHETLMLRSKAATPHKDIPHVTLQPVDIRPAPSAEYKTIPTVQRELLTQFEDIEQNQILLDELLHDSEDLLNKK
ncbi:hypothetical protein INR49_001212 [Caranx melampygus]|nr:hypothetical protein INR49_001212 [Caranx melampygus]